VTAGDRLRAEIAAAPMSVATYMARSNAAYYATRDPFGAAGDFMTAPEISQIFGELVGAWLADRWVAAGSPPRSVVVELGPGRGTMMADMRRSFAAAGWAPEVVMVETSPVLRAAQLSAVPDAVHHDALAQVRDDATTFVVANEFFDALPVRQFDHTPAGWRERMVVATAAGLAFAAGPDDATPLVPPALAASPIGSVIEVCPTGTAIAAEIGMRVQRHGGAALIVDYGHVGPLAGETLQAVQGHARADVLVGAGVDLTAHVDFTALAVAAGVTAWGPVGQGSFLRAIGINARAATLKARATDAQAVGIDAAAARLTGDDAMGRLFKVMALTAGGTAPPGFA